MHPVIRIASFLVIAISLAQVNQQKLTTAAIILLLLFFIQPSFFLLQKIIKLVYRLRWLFVSIFIIYAWFTPGQLLVPEWAGLSPYQEGIVTGLMRIAALIMILIAVSILVLNLNRDELISAIHWYCLPLNILGLSRKRLAARLVLTIESVSTMESRWMKTASTDDASNNGIQNHYQRVLQLFNDVIRSAEEDKLKTISFPLMAAPAWYQWFIPVILLLIFQLT